MQQQIGIDLESELLASAGARYLRSAECLGWAKSVSCVHCLSEKDIPYVQP